MDIERKLYDARTGAVYFWNHAKKAVEKETIQYVSPNPYPAGRGIPDAEFQNIFGRCFIAALDNANDQANYGFAFDGSKITGFPGYGFINGILTFLVCRRDQPGNEDYRVQVSADIAVNSWNGSGTALQKRFFDALIEIDKKR